MNATMDELLDPVLAQRLRRLGLLQDERNFPELDEAEVPREVQRTMLGPSYARQAIRRWTDRDKAGLPLTTTDLLIVLEQMRQQPVIASPFLDGISSQGFGAMIARCALNAARNLHRDGREQFAEARVDQSVNYMLEAQREFLFALSTGFLSREERTEALGKYAVAVAFSSRWRRTNRQVLERALKYHSQSISAGNDSSEAFEYLVELRAELFNVTSASDHLDNAVSTAETHGLHLTLAELLVKRGLLRQKAGTGPAIPDFQGAIQLAEIAVPRSGVEYVQQALVKQLSLEAILNHCPLTAEQIRLPYGFLGNMARLDPQSRKALRTVVLDALGPMREGLKQRGMPPNLVAQQVLFAVLRDSLSRGEQEVDADAELIVEVAFEARARGGDRYLEYQYSDALLVRAESLRERSLTLEAIAEAEALIQTYPHWPLPQVTRAAGITLLSRLGPDGHDPELAQAAWSDAARAVVNSPDYRRSDLGGRSSVFAIEDARGDLATALVFKPFARQRDAEREAAHMRALLASVREKGLEGQFGVPRSLAIVQLPPNGTVHVIERQAGALLSDLHPDIASGLLPRCVEFLALFHNAADPPQEHRSAWGRLKNGLKLWSPALFRDKKRANEFVAAMAKTMPSGLPLLRKRDAHASNWVVDEVGRLVAVDLEAGSFLPVGHDFAQLIEDHAVLPVSREEFDRRQQLLHAYLDMLAVDVNVDEAISGYGWFALLRATWIASSASASKARHIHARRLTQYLLSAPEYDAIRVPAEMLSAAMRQPAKVEVGGLDANHRRMSKRLAQVLRHGAEELGLRVDDAGFIALKDLAGAVGMSIAEIEAVANHPGEPRFEIDELRIRALYGHSLVVPDLPDLDIELPDTLFHGTSWDSLEVISAEGLRPMDRQKVHLTNNPAEALEVAKRHPQPALLAIRTTDTESLQAVADAVWAANAIAPELIEIRNPFNDISTPPAWLTDSMTTTEDLGGNGL